MCRTEMIVNANTVIGSDNRCNTRALITTARYPLVNARLRARHPRPGTLPSAKNDERRPGRAPAHAAPTGTAGLRAPRASNTTCAVGFGCVCVLCGMSPCAHKSNGRFKRACTDWIVLVCKGAVGADAASLFSRPSSTAKWTTSTTCQASARHNAPPPHAATSEVPRGGGAQQGRVLPRLCPLATT